MIRKSSIVLTVACLTVLSCWGQTTIPKPVMNYVSVDPYTNDVTIAWHQSNDPDVDGYLIYRFEPDAASYPNGDFMLVGSAVGRNVLSFVNTFENPTTLTSSIANMESEIYSIKAYDDETNSKSAHSDIHATIFLTSLFRPCYSEIRLAWSAYEGWTNGVSNYVVWQSKNGAPWAEYATVAGNITNLNIFDLEPDVDYYYYIEALSGGVTSTSNMVKEYTDMPHAPTMFYGNYATVQDENYIQLSFTVDTTADVNKYKLLRTDSLGDDYDTIMVFAPVQGQEIYTHVDHAPTDKVHYYMLQAINTCNVPFARTSNLCTNIYLEATAQSTMRNKLKWTNYLRWKEGISHFDVYRVVDYMDPVLMEQVPYGDTTFNDKLDEYLYKPVVDYNNPLLDIEPGFSYLEQPITSGLVCYYVIAVEKLAGTEDREPYESKSNTVCVSQMPRVFVPNAFTPNNDGLNDVFYPQISFAGLNGYELRIYNRWGNIVFRTTHVHHGWDGTQFDGSTPAPVGSYVYQFTYIDGENKEHEEIGHVTLVR